MELKIDPATLHRLPRHPDWKYEVWDGTCHLSHRPKALPLQRSTSLPVQLPRIRDDRLTARALDLADHPAVEELLGEVWRDLDPYRTMDDGLRELNADIVRTLDKRPDGAVAVDEAGRIVGVAPVVADRDGAPMLTFLTVRSWDQRRGAATCMLDALVRQLDAGGQTVLLSGASPGNAASLHWHLYHGFTYRPWLS